MFPLEIIPHFFRRNSTLDTRTAVPGKYNAARMVKAARQLPEYLSLLPRNTFTFFDTGNDETPTSTKSHEFGTARGRRPYFDVSIDRVGFYIDSGFVKHGDKARQLFQHTDTRIDIGRVQSLNKLSCIALATFWAKLFGSFRGPFMHPHPYTDPHTGPIYRRGLRNPRSLFTTSVGMRSVTEALKLSNS